MSGAEHGSGRWTGSGDGSGSGGRPPGEAGPCAAESAALLERALGYALCCVRAVTSTALTRPTPCRGWDLGMLLRHANDSLAALREATDAGSVDMWPSGETPAACEDPAAAFRAGATGLLGACAVPRPPAGGDGAPATVAVGGLPLAAAVVARTGALEIAVHGWDIARATGLPKPLPAALAVELLRTARQVLPRPDRRQPLFAPPVPVPPRADPGDRLVAYLGRDPARPFLPARPSGHDGRPSGR